MSILVSKLVSLERLWRLSTYGERFSLRQVLSLKAFEANRWQMRPPVCYHLYALI